MALQHLRSNTASKRPTAGAMSDGQIAVNTNATSPGLFFKDAGGAIIKVGPVHVGTTAPNSSPAGSTGNSLGEQWLDTSGGGYVLKIWDGSAWRSEVGEFVDAAGDTMTGALILPNGTAAAPALGVGSTDNGLYSPGTDQVALSTNGTGRLIINSSGNVGIRTSSPGNSLEVVGDYLSGAEGHGTLNITSNNTGNGGQDARPSIGFSAPFGPANERILYGLIEGRKENAALGISAGFLAFSTSPLSSAGPVERMRITSLGRVGIGTTAPGVALDVNGDARADGLYGYGDSNTGIDFPGSDVIVFKEGGAEAARIDSSGRFLVGTSSWYTIPDNRFGQAWTQGQQIKIIDAPGAYGGLAIISASTALNQRVADISLNRQDGNTDYAALSSGNPIGSVTFNGADGTQFVRAASITAWVDGTPGANDMPGRLVFSTTADGASSPTEQLRITSDRYVRLASGTGGIQFNGDTAAANALDDYEEGTFTPALNWTNVTYTTQLGKYTKIGNRVFFSINLAWTANDASSSTLINLPFGSTSTNERATISVQNTALPANFQYPVADIFSSTVYVRYVNTSGAYSNFYGVAANDAGTIAVTGNYAVS